MWKLLLLTTAATAVELKQKMIIRNTGSEDLAVYFMGALHEGDLSLWDGSETLNDIVSPGQVTARYVRYNDSFAVRSGDLKWRVRLSLYKNDDAEQPYKVTFHNVMTDEKDQPVELKHHAAGYLWIEPNHHVTPARRRATSSRCGTASRKKDWPCRCTRSVGMSCKTLHLGVDAPLLPGVM